MKPLSSISLESLSERNISIQLLIVDDEEHILSAVTRQLMDLPVHVLTAHNTEQARHLLETYSIDVALVDHQLGESVSGLEFLAQMSQDYSSCFRVIFTGEGDFSFAVDAINRGHVDAYLAKPWTVEQLQTLIRQGASSSYIRGLNITLTEELAQQNYELEKLNQNLENIVDNRTQELAYANSRLHIYQDEMVLLETQAAVSQLVRGLAHELNNPLGVILGHAQRLKRHDRADGKVGQGMSIIEEEVERCRKLIERLRSYAVSDDPVVEKCSAQEIIDIAVARLKQRGETVPQIHLTEDVPSFPASARTFGRVVDHIMSNAITAEARNIFISHTYKRDRLLIHLDNDGLAPSEHEIRNAVKPFFSNRVNATGLGLSIASALLGEHGSTLNFDQSPNHHGARCTIQLAPLENMNENSPLHNAVLTQASLLIIDDEPLINELITEACRDLPIHCHCCTSIQSALADLTDKEFSAVIIDASLPDGNGCDIIEDIINNHPQLKGHIALITGDPNQETVQITRNAHNIPVLGKPFSMNELTELIIKIT